MPSFQCRTCHRTVEHNGQDAPYYPFCSARCQMVDLGAWFDEQYRIPVSFEPEAESGQEPPDRPADH